MCVSACDLWVEDADEQKCVKNCPEGAKYHDKSGKCVSSCPKKVNADDLCVDSENGNKSWLVPTIIVPVAIAVCVVAVIFVVACKRRRRLAARNQKKPVLKQLSIPDSKTLAKSAVESSLLKPGMLGDSNDASMGSSSDKKSEQSSAKSGSKHRKAGSKRHRSKPAPAVKEVPLLGEEAPEPRPDAHKKGKHRHRRPQGGVSGEAKAALDLHLQEIGKGVGLTPMKVGEGVRSEE